MSAQLPETLAGHWGTADGREMAERYLAQGRSDLSRGDVSDMALANAQYLEDISIGTATIQSAIGMQTAAKERIRWLSAHLAAANLTNDELLAALTGMLDIAIGAGWSDAEYREKLRAERRPHPDLVDAYADRVLAARRVVAKATGGVA